MLRPGGVPSRPADLPYPAVVLAASSGRWVKGRLTTVRVSRTIAVCLVAIYNGRYSRSMNGEQVVAQALNAIRRAYEEAATIIERIPDPQKAFDQADELANGIRKVYDDLATPLQRRQVERIWESEAMTLAELAKRTNRSSRQRAYQMLQDALDRKE